LIARRYASVGYTVSSELPLNLEDSMRICREVLTPLMRDWEIECGSIRKIPLSGGQHWVAFEMKRSFPKSRIEVFALSGKPDSKTVVSVRTLSKNLADHEIADTLLARIESVALSGSSEGTSQPQQKGEEPSVLLDHQSNITCPNCKNKSYTYQGKYCAVCGAKLE
jgi:hypothetical protein